jgi:methylphosphotriester-DNA--protein-cysteine methyltransferase
MLGLPSKQKSVWLWHWEIIFSSSEFFLGGVNLTKIYCKHFCKSWKYGNKNKNKIYGKKQQKLSKFFLPNYLSKVWTLSFPM